ncbi:T-cell surface glycoprotein CD3 delta chain [Gasterosteus aculeatus]
MESAFPACLLLLWALTAPVSGTTVFEVTDELNEIKLSCFNGTLPLEYRDNNTGEYQCGDDGTKIYVKFRTCDNCIELDEGAIAGMVVGNVVATLVIGVAVYLIASQTPIGAPSAGKKSSDRQRLAPNGVSSPTDDHYQPLQNRQRDLYDRVQTAAR